MWWGLVGSGWWPLLPAAALRFLRAALAGLLPLTQAYPIGSAPWNSDSDSPGILVTRPKREVCESGGMESPCGPA
eukprot:356798-Chlamydomonas_euryale.AAC.3